MLTITLRRAVFLFALVHVPAAGQAPAGRITATDAVPLTGQQCVLDHTDMLVFEQDLEPIGGHLSATWMDTLGRHYAQNVGKTPVRIVLVEIKSAS